MGSQASRRTRLPFAKGSMALRSNGFELLKDPKAIQASKGQ